MKRTPLISCLFPLVFALVGWCGIVYYAYRTVDAMEHVEGRGVIIESGISRNVSTHKGHKTVAYSPEILYRYTVDGVEYSCDRYSLCNWSTGDYEAQKAVVGRFPKGAEVSVWYHPQNPAKAFLLQPHWTSAWMIFAVFGLFAFVGTALFVLVMRSRRRTSPSPAPEDSEGEPDAEGELDASMAWESDPPKGVSVERSFETQELILTYRPRNWLTMIIGLGIFAAFFVGGSGTFLVVCRHLLEKGGGPELLFLGVFLLLFGILFPMTVIYQAFGRQTLTFSPEGGRFFFGVGRIGLTRRMPLDCRTKVGVSLSYRGKGRTPAYTIELDNGDMGKTRTFLVMRDEGLANGFRDFIRRQLARM